MSTFYTSKNVKSTNLAPSNHAITLPMNLFTDLGFNHSPLRESGPTMEAHAMAIPKSSSIGGRCRLIIPRPESGYILPDLGL